MLTLDALRIEIAKSYRVAVDLLSEISDVLEDIHHKSHRIATEYRRCVQHDGSYEKYEIRWPTLQ